jgi:hypothetical protein
MTGSRLQRETYEKANNNKNSTGGSGGYEHLLKLLVIGDSGN